MWSPRCGRSWPTWLPLLHSVCNEADYMSAYQAQSVGVLWALCCSLQDASEETGQIAANVGGDLFKARWFATSHGARALRCERGAEGCPSYLSSIDLHEDLSDRSPGMQLNSRHAHESGHVYDDAQSTAVIWNLGSRDVAGVGAANME